MRNPTLSLVQVSRQPFNAETPLPALLEDVTPLDLVYVRNNFEVPRTDPSGWAVRVGGAVKEPFSISLQELRQQPSRTTSVTMECAGNARSRMKPVPSGTPWGYGAVSVIRFTGTPLAGVLERAGVAPEAIEVVFVGADRGEVEPGRVESFARSLPLTVASNPDNLLAWEMNGRPLTEDHGSPLRLVVPGAYGMASVKWLKEIEVLAEPFTGHFQTERYIYIDEPGTPPGEPVRRMRVRSLIAQPGEGATLERGEIEIRGVAWSGFGAITKVEVCADGGHQWHVAALDPAATPYGARLWRHVWTPRTAGSCTLTCRATDSAGNVQPAVQVWNRLGYGNNGPQIVAVNVV